MKQFVIPAITALILTIGNVWQANASSPDIFIHERVDRGVTFSDSLSDTGNLFDLTALFPDVYPQPFPPQIIIDPVTSYPSAGYFLGRFADGPVWLEYFIAVSYTHLRAHET